MVKTNSKKDKNMVYKVNFKDCVDGLFVSRVSLSALIETMTDENGIRDFFSALEKRAAYDCSLSNENPDFIQNTSIQLFMVENETYIISCYLYNSQICYFIVERRK